MRAYYSDSGIIDINGKILGKRYLISESIGVLIENPAFIGNYTDLESCVEHSFRKQN